MTLIAASIATHEPEEVPHVLQRAADAVGSGANLIEWRIDALAAHDEALAAAAQLVRESPAPCIVTCRDQWEGGEYSGLEVDRAKLLTHLITAEMPPRYTDIELSAIQRDSAVWKPVLTALEEQRSRDLHTSLILSAHDFKGRPADLLQRIESMANHPQCAIIKVAWHARSLRDNLEAFDLSREFRRHKPVIAICMGPFGLLSRVLAGKFGGFLTFAVDREMEVTGPGQPTIDELLKLYRFDRITPQTRLFGIIGWPVSHSKSPAIHNAGFEAVGFDGVYLPLPIPPEYEHFKATVGALIDHSGLNFRGASVTLPHKENLLRFVRERGGRIEPLTESIGAANTLVVGSAGGLECLNTDCPAAIESLCAGMHIDRKELARKTVAVIGAGGVARAIIAGLRDVGSRITVFNRSYESAARVAEAFASRETTSGDAGVHAKALDEITKERFDAIVNCTPIGMTGGPMPDDLPVPREVIMDDSVTVMDTVYTPERTPLIQEAEARGARAVTGVDMFVRQAALQFEKWTGVPGPAATFEAILNRT